MEDKILAFNNYANFLSDKFGISVVFDGANAHTDGKIITLPKIDGVGEKELDFLYCVLLHEIGHIKYSDFSLESFKKIKSDNQFLIANAIEDARVENILIKEFDGATEIFDSLYNKFSADSEFMTRVFGFDIKEMNFVKAISLYVHQKLIKIPKKPDIKKITKTATYNRLIKFIKKTNLDRIIEKSELRCWNDVVVLSEKIYNLIFNGDKKDKSAKVDLDLKEKIISSSLDDLCKSVNEYNKESAELERLKSELQIKKNSVKEIQDSISDEISKISKEICDLHEESLSIESIIELFDQKSTIINSLDKLSLKLENKKSKSELILGKIKKLESQETLSEKKNTQLEKSRELSRELNSKITEISNKKNSLELDLTNVEDKIKNLDQKPEFYTLKQSQVKDSLAEKEKDLASKENSLNELKSEINEFNANVKEKKQAIKSDLIGSISRTYADLADSGVSILSMPKKEVNPDWAESSLIQNEFDKSASIETGSIVIGGVSGAGTSIREIVLSIEKAKSELSNIDLLEVFKKEKLMSRFDLTKEADRVRSADSESYSYFPELNNFSNRKHTPLTKEFDTVKNLKVGGSKQHISSFNELSSEISNAKKIIGKKLKAKQKIKFISNKEEGLLDTRSIWKLATKTDDRFFEIEKKVKDNDVCVSIAVDVSGSMAEKDTLRKTKDAVLILSEALKSVGVKHEVIGYHAPICDKMKNLEGSNKFYNRTINRLETIVYKDFSDRSNMGIQNIEFNCSDNSDGESIRFIASRLKKERGKRRILIVVTDGKPFLSESSVSVLDNDLKTCLTELKKQKIEVFALGFNECPVNFYKESFYKLEEARNIIDFLNQKI